MTVRKVVTYLGRGFSFIKDWFVSRNLLVLRQKIRLYLGFICGMNNKRIIVKSDNQNR